MPERVTGLDIGSDSIKAVSVSAGLRGYQVLDAVNVSMAQSGGLKESLDLIFQREAFRKCPCVATVPLDRCSLRYVRLPFRDRKKISRTLPFELEQTIAFPADEAVCDYQILGRAEETELLALAVRESDLAGRLSLLAPYAGSIPIIDVESAPLTGLVSDGAGGAASSILIDAGAERTALVVMAAGRIIHLRSFPLGGQDITADLSKRLGVGLDEAEALKRAAGPGVEEATRSVCRALHRDISNTLNVLRLRGILTDLPGCLYLAGGCSLSEPFRNEMEQLFSLPLREIPLPGKGAIQFPEELQDRWIPGVMHQALALALREAGTVRGFNFIRNSFAMPGMVQKILDELPWLGPVAAAVVLMLGLNLAFEYRNDSRYLESLRQESRALFMQTLPETTRIVDPVQQMRTALADVARSSEGHSGGRSVTVLSILRDISSLVPETAEFLITNFTFDQMTVRLQGETDNFNTVETIRTSLERGNSFRSVTISSASLMRQGGRVGFDLRMELTP